MGLESRAHNPATVELGADTIGTPLIQEGVLKEDLQVDEGVKIAGIDLRNMSHAMLSGMTTGDPHTQYIRHALSTAANDFLVGSGSNTLIKKTLSETKTILGITAGVTLGFPGTEVYNSTKGTSYEDLDLSSYVGSNSAIVFLRVQGPASTGYEAYFRQNGESNTPSIITTYNPSVAISGNSKFNSIIVVTDSSGVIEWATDNASQTWKINLLAYLK